MKLNLAKPNKENLNTFVTLGSVLILVGFFDFLANTFLDLNFTGFLPGGLSFLTPIIIGVIGLHFIRIEFSGNRLLDKINTNFNSSNFDRVRLSYPQTGSSFKPFIYASSLANGYNLSSLINDAPIAFEDENLESVWLSLIHI